MDNYTGEVLVAVFKEKAGYSAVWVDYDTGKIKIDNVGEDKLGDRPITAAFFNNYNIDTRSLPPCAKILTYGPAAGGIGEAGAFRLATCGERILSLVPYRGFKKNRSMLKMTKDMDVSRALPYFSRLSGQFAASYTTLFINLAFDDLDESFRTLSFAAVEMERIHNHVWVMHKLANDAAQKVASAHLSALTEEFLRLNSIVFGSRYLMDYPILYKKYDGFHDRLKELESEFNGLIDELLHSRIFIDRLHTTGKLNSEDVIKNDITGIPARAAAVSRDSRKFSVLKDFYGDHEPRMEEGGDALSRFLVRVSEVKDSISLLKEITLPNKIRVPEKPSNGLRYGLIEAPPGDIFMMVHVEDGKLKSVKIRPPSVVMLHAFSIGVRGNVFTDYPFALDSFGLYFADADLYGGW